jgi:dTDP-4-dehydrorhamnose 3,5-epimerase
VAHGFYAADELLMAYMVTAYYDGSDEHGVLWNDPDLAIQWPTTSPILSQRDQKNARWADVPAEVRP